MLNGLYFSKINYQLMITSLLLLLTGFTTMYTDPEIYGNGWVGLTLSPLLLLAGFTLPAFAIFAGCSKRLPVTRFQKIQNLTAALLGTGIFFLYAFTAEPTVSFWDCGEFIAAASRLEIPHPPGAPLYLLIGRIFALFARKPQDIAYAVNLVSAAASAFTCVLVFSITCLLLKKIVLKDSCQTNIEKLMLLSGSILAALILAFSDAFWFNATEAEVYGLSTFFSALSFWGMLKWESEDEKTSGRWLLFIAYVTGLSIGVHLLSLLALPVMVVIYYFKKFKPSWKGSLVAVLIGVALVLFLSEGFIIGLPTLAGKVEVFCTNELGLPFNTGALIFLTILVCSLITLIFRSHQKNRKLFHVSGLCFAMLLIGYCSYFLVLVRSSFNPPLDENDPGDLMSLILYLKRDQYGSRPLLYGPMFTAGQPTGLKKTSPKYRKDIETGKYRIYDYNYSYTYDPKQCMLFPRAYSTEEQHQEAYRSWMKLAPGKKPRMMDNLRFFFSYQLGHQFFRYFLWNFAGRESDIQDASWIKPVEWFRKDLPETLNNNRARNNYFFLPLLLGIAGAAYLYQKDKKSTALLLLLFVFSGPAIIVYLNQPPIEPRERDYTFTGAYLVFSIFCGAGLMFLMEWSNRQLKVNKRILVTFSFVVFGIPWMMLKENWDDHNRSGRHFARTSANNILNACEPQAILFTAADNDTFPLWYLQETEQVRSDVRICNLSLLNLDWYIQGMEIPSNYSNPVALSLTKKEYQRGINDFVYLQEDPRFNNGIDLNGFLELIKRRDPLVIHRNDEQEWSVLPSKKIILKVDKRRKEIGKPGQPQSGKEKMEFLLPEGLSKAALMALDIIRSNHWIRPVYLNYSAIHEMPFLKPYLSQEGFLYRLQPFKMKDEKIVDTDQMYRHLMHAGAWVGLNDPAIYHDPAGTPFIAQSRMQFRDLAWVLLQENKPDEAKKVIDFCEQWIPDKTCPYDFTALQFSQILLEAGDRQKAVKIAETMGTRSIEWLSYYNAGTSSEDGKMHYYILSECCELLQKAKSGILAKKFISEAEKYRIQNNF